jgi:hypothetical protein
MKASENSACSGLSLSADLFDRGLENVFADVILKNSATGSYAGFRFAGALVLLSQTRRSND